MIFLADNWQWANELSEGKKLNTANQSGGVMIITFKPEARKGGDFLPFSPFSSDENDLTSLRIPAPQEWLIKWLRLDSVISPLGKGNVENEGQVL